MHDFQWLIFGILFVLIVAGIFKREDISGMFKGGKTGSKKQQK